MAAIVSENGLKLHKHYIIAQTLSKYSNTKMKMLLNSVFLQIQYHS